MNKLSKIFSRYFNKLWIYLRYWKRKKLRDRFVEYPVHKSSSLDSRPENSSANVSIDFIETNTSITELEAIVKSLEYTLENEIDNKKKTLITSLKDVLAKAKYRSMYLRNLDALEVEFERIFVEQKRLASDKVGFQPYESVDLQQLKSTEEDLITNGFTEAETFEEVNTSEIFDLNEILEKLKITPLDYEYLQDSAVWQEENSDEENNIFCDHLRMPEANANPTNQKEHAVLIVDYLKENDIHYIYHVTATSNIDSIQKYGLLSWQRLEHREISYENNVADNTSKSLDRRYQKEDYVRLSFCKATPMFYIKKHLQSNSIFKVPIECLLEVEYEFSNMNATDNRVKFGRTLDFLKNQVKARLAAKGNYHILDEDDKKYYQAEVLIKGHLPSKFTTTTITF